MKRKELHTNTVLSEKEAEELFEEIKLTHKWSKKPDEEKKLIYCCIKQIHKIVGEHEDGRKKIIPYAGEEVKFYIQSTKSESDL
jgi:hypothetical protein